MLLFFFFVDDFAFDWFVGFLVALGCVFSWGFGFCLLVHFGADWHQFVVQFFGSSFEFVLGGISIANNFLSGFDGFFKCLFVVVANLVSVFLGQLFGLVDSAIEQVAGF